LENVRQDKREEPNCGNQRNNNPLASSGIPVTPRQHEAKQPRTAGSAKINQELNEMQIAAGLVIVSLGS
jgi:hypothetical protein